MRRLPTGCRLWPCACIDVGGAACCWAAAEARSLVKLLAGTNQLRLECEAMLLNRHICCLQESAMTPLAQAGSSNLACWGMSLRPCAAATACLRPSLRGRCHPEHTRGTVRCGQLLNQGAQ